VGILAGIFVLRHPLLTALTMTTVLVFILGMHVLVMGLLHAGACAWQGVQA